MDMILRRQIPTLFAPRRGHVAAVLKSSFLTAFASCLAVTFSFATPQPADEALPIVGTGGHGHTYPGATMPFGFVQLSPDTRTEGWDACAGYHYSDSSILGFSHTHISGTGCADLADLLVVPVSGKLDGTADYEPLKAERFKSSFSHNQETAEPGYYRVKLDRYDILAELTATAHAGMHRYTFPASEESHLLLDLVHGIGNKPVEASLKMESNILVTGHRRTDGWAKGRVIYFALECSQPFNGFGLELDGKALPADRSEVSGKNVRAHLDYTASPGRQILLRVGLSAVSVEGAKKNLQAEIASWDFDGIHQAARTAWNENLSRIHIESSNPNVRQTFYSALYHTMTAPRLYNDADGSYRGPDQKIHSAGFQYYSTLSLWDTFRAEHPLLTLTQPERVNDFIQTMLAFYQESPDHALPMWPLDSYETWCMIGYHSVPVIYDAYTKGFRGFDPELAYKAMRDSAMNARNHQDEYQKLGYVPAATGKRNEATSRTLEFSFDDWCIAQMARTLGKSEDAELFTKRSRNYRNVFDPVTGFFRGKTAAGTFREPFDPKAVSFDDYTEANAWQYTFAVPHDVPDMIQLYGGKTAFINKLDQLFDADSDIGNYLIDVSGLIGQYSHGNEPCHHIAYLYTLAGTPYKTAQRVRQIMLTQYDNTPEGICGNDDCGQMSAWYVWSALGLYPLNPASGIYIIGSPIVEKATVQLDPKFYKGGTFTIVAHNASKQNCYVQSVKLNGKRLDRPWITHKEIVNGGTLELEMSIQPNKAWGANPALEELSHLAGQ
jgi:predicted alpha-1,2-mannosidase